MKRVPVVTYRLQLHGDFTFRDAAECLDYLDRLGVGDLYLSPIFEAREGSRHGYDVVDPNEVRHELGGEPELVELHRRLERHRMGLLLDIVPNHMCVAGGENRWWDDVLLHGRASPYAHFFDIDWDNDGAHGHHTRIVLPFLGTSLDDALADRQIAVVRTGGALFIEYGKLRFPLRLESWKPFLDPAARHLERRNESTAGELRNLLVDLERLAPQSSEPVHAQKLQEATARLQERFMRLVRVSPDVRESVDARIREVNETPFELRAILTEQHYELVDWRQAGTSSSSYRRFFDINELAGLRVEDPDVLRATHSKIFDLLSRRIVTGLRVDHVDGLRDPEGYLRVLPRESFVVVEKILEGSERLRSDWPVEGTTGYEFLNALNGIFVDPSSENLFRERYGKFVRAVPDFEEVLYRSKKLVLATSFMGDVRRLTRLLVDTGAFGGATRELLTEAITEIAACFPVYRTYVRPTDETVSAPDRRTIREAVDRAKDRARADLEPLIDSMGELLCLDRSPDTREREFALRLQQLTGAVMAKGFEDTALYRHYPLASLNEVGGHPDRFGVGVIEFHRFNEERQRDWPHGLSTTSTHDTKRSEDVRARLDVLSELGERWWDAVSEWRRLNRKHQSREIDPNDEYLVYQTIVGAWPPEVSNEAAYGEFVGRIQAYVRKTLREAKVSSSWVRPDESYEEAVSSFVASILDTWEGAAFLEALTSFLATILDAGFLNSISQVLLKIASPGVPDFYQGSESWEYNLVDPDNRRPVDFDRRRRALAAMDEAVGNGGLDSLVREVFGDLNDGRLKLFVTSRGLRFRRDHRALFEKGDYVPLRVSGVRADHAVAFARVRGDESAIAAVGRYFTRLPKPPTKTAWRDTRLDLGALPGAVFRDVLTQREVRAVEGSLPLETVFASLSVSLLERIE